MEGKGHGKIREFGWRNLVEEIQQVVLRRSPSQATCGLEGREGCFCLTCASFFKTFSTFTSFAMAAGGFNSQGLQADGTMMELWGPVRPGQVLSIKCLIIACGNIWRYIMPQLWSYNNSMCEYRYDDIDILCHNSDITYNDKAAHLNKEANPWRVRPSHLIWHEHGTQRWRRYMKTEILITHQFWACTVYA